MAEEILQEDQSVEPIESSVDLQVDVAQDPPVKTGGMENIKKLHGILAADDVYKQIVPADFNAFVTKYKNPEKLSKLHGILVADDVYSQVMPADINKAAEKYDLGKPSADPSASSGGGSAMNVDGREQPFTLQAKPAYLSPEELASGANELPSENSLSQVKENFAQQKSTGERSQAPLITEDQLNAQRLAAVERARKDKETEALSKKGTYLGALRNSIADGYSKTVEDAAYTAMSALESFAPDMVYGPGSENLSSREKAKLFDSAMEDMGIKKSLDKEFYVLKGVSVPTKDPNTTPEYIERVKQEGGDIQQGIMGFGGSMFPMAMQLGPMKATGFFVSTFADAKKEIQQVMPDADPKAQAFYALTQGLVAATLEEVGMSNLLKNKSFTKALSGKVMNAIKESTGFYSAKEIPSVVKNIINGYASEFETGVTQFVVEEGVKQLADAMEGDANVFKFDGIAPFIANAFHAGNQEGIGGGIVKTVHSIPSLIKNPIKQKEAAQKVEQSAAMEADLNNPDVSPEAKAGIQAQIDENDDHVLGVYADDKHAFDQLSPEQKTEITDINNQISQHQAILSDANVSEQTKAFSEEKIKELETASQKVMESKPEQNIQVESMSTIGESSSEGGDSKKPGIKTVAEIVAEQKQKKAAGERMQTAKELFAEQKAKGEQIRLNKEGDAQAAIDEQRARRDAEVKEIEAIRPDLTTEDVMLSDLPASIWRVMDRMDANIPTDITLVDENIAAIDKKFDELQAYRDDPKRTHTIEQINEIEDLLDSTKKELQYYKEAVIDDEKSISERTTAERIAETKVNEAPAVAETKAEPEVKPEPASVETKAEPVTESQPTTPTNTKSDEVTDVKEPQGEVRTQEGGTPGSQNEASTTAKNGKEGKPKNVQEEVKPEPAKPKVSKPVAAAAKATDDFIADIGNLLANEIEVAANPKGPKAVAEELIKKLEAIQEQIKTGNFSTIPLLPQAARLAIEIAIRGIRAGATVVEAMQQAMAEFRSHSDYIGASDATKVQAERDMAVMLFNAFGEGVSGETRTSKFGAKAVSELKQNGASRSLVKLLDPGYESRNQKEVEAAAKEFIAAVGMGVAVDASVNLQVSLDLAASVLNENYKQARETALNDSSEQNARKLDDAFRALKELGTKGGQLIAMFGRIREQMPEFVVDEFISDIRRASHSAMGSNENNPSTGIHKAMKAARQVGKVKNDVWNTIAGLMSGDLVAPVGTFGFSERALKAFKDKVAALTNKKVSNAFKVLIAFGEFMKNNDGAKLGFEQLMADVVNRGKLAAESNSAEVRSVVVANLNDVNGKLTIAMTPAQIESTADAFVEVYNKMCEDKMAQQINEAFRDRKRSISAGKNKKIARLILSGALDEETVRAKFASKYNLPTLTPANIAQLQTLATNAANAKGGAKIAANARLQQAIDDIRSESKPGLKLNEKLWWLPNFIYNNVLAFPKTMLTAFGSNVIRTGGVILEAITTNRFSNIKNSISGMSVEVDLPDGRGGNIKKKLNLNRTAVEMQSAILGIPSLTQFRELGITDVERRINEQPSKWKRNVMRTFLVSGQRTLGIVDALASPLVAAITQRQMMELFVKDMYASSGIPVPNKTTITNDVNSLVKMDASLMNEMSAEAINDVMTGNRRQLLIDRGSLDPNTTFAEIFGSRNPLKAETELFNEYKKRILEIHAEGINNRLNELQQRKGHPNGLSFDPDLDFSDKLSEVDRFIARKTNELAFLGRPPGTLGIVADQVNRVSETVPGLKYVGILPMFNNAAFNGAAYIVKMTPVLNAVQLTKYLATGTRGYKTKDSKGDKHGEFKTKYIIRADQKSMARSVAATTAFAAGLLWAMAKMLGTPEEQREQWEKKNGTGFIDNLTAGQKELLRDRNNQPLREGWFYKEGYPLFEYSKTPLYGLFEAVAYVHNASVFEREYFGDKLFVEDDPEVSEIMGGYLLNTMFTITDASAMRDFSNVLYGVMNMKPENKDPKWYEGTMKVMESKMANAIKNLIPLGRLQGGIANAIDAYGGDEKKFAADFRDKLAMNTLYADYVIHSNLTDPFGRDVEEVFKTNGMTIGFNMFEVKKGEIVTFLDQAYPDDKHMQLYINRNFGYSARASINAPVYLKTDEIVLSEDDQFGSDVESVGSQLLKMNEDFKSKGIKTEELTKEREGDPFAGFVYTLELEPEQVNTVNAKMGKMAKSFIDHGQNFDLLSPTKDDNSFTDEKFGEIMNSVYDMGKRISVYSLYGKELGEPYRQSLLKAMTGFENKMIKLNLTVPVEWNEQIQD